MYLDGTVFVFRPIWDGHFKCPRCMCKFEDKTTLLVRSHLLLRPH